MNILPRNIYKGRNSDGSSFRVEEWDYETLIGLELPGQIFVFILCLIIIPFVAPLFTILAILSFSGRFNLLYIPSLIFGGYFLYDCSIGYFSVLSLSFFIDEAIINLFVKANIIAVIVTLVLLLFGGLFRTLVMYPFEKYDDDAYMLLPTKDKEALRDKLVMNQTIFQLLIVAIIYVSFVFGGLYLSDKQGWVERNIHADTKYKKEELKQEEASALGDFKSKEEREAYFRNSEKKWGD